MRGADRAACGVECRSWRRKQRSVSPRRRWKCKTMTMMIVSWNCRSKTMSCRSRRCRCPPRAASATAYVRVVVHHS